MTVIEENEADLKDLIARALRGERVVITRAGKPVAELTPAAREVAAEPRALTQTEWRRLAAGSQARRISSSGADIVRQMRDEGP